MINIEELKIRVFGAEWTNLQSIPSKLFDCGYCGKTVASKEGYLAAKTNTIGYFGFIYICPNCTAPVFCTKHGDTSAVMR